MTEKHVFEQLREAFLPHLDELELGIGERNGVLAKLDRSINQVLMGVSSNHAAPKKKELTRGQKIAQSRKRNAAKRAAEEAAGESGDGEN